MQVACGKCGACQQARRTEWSFRLRWEAKSAIQSAFITLTYSEENLPFADPLPTLVKADLQKWFKLVRKKTKLRYYAVGEYGTETKRPHYHVCAFFNENIDVYQLLTDTWKHGHFHVGKITDASIHYCTKYHITTDKKLSDEYGRIPEFAVMSLKPPIGINYLEKNRGFHENREMRTYVMQNGFKLKIPRMYRKKLFQSEEEKRKLVYRQTIDQQYGELPEQKYERLTGDTGGYYSSILQKAKEFRRKVKRDTF